MSRQRLYPTWPSLQVGVPNVGGLRRTRIVQADGSPYLDRYHLVDTPEGSVRLHHWLSSDPRTPHDHPWSNASTVLAGTLLEHTTAGKRELTPGVVVTRSPADPHRVELVGDEAWTLFVTGPAVRRWGFHTEGGWVYWSDWSEAGRYEDEEQRW